MRKKLKLQQLLDHHFPTHLAPIALDKINQCLELPSESAWQKISTEIINNDTPFSTQELLFNTVYPEWPDKPENAAAWIPAADTIKTTNLFKVMSENNFTDVNEFHAWSHKNYNDFWQLSLQKLSIQFKKPFTKICDLSQGLEKPNWLLNAKMNIIDSCFQANPNATALIYPQNTVLKKLTFHDLELLVNQIANSLVAANFKKGEPIAIIMPMTIYAVAIYLSIIKMGGIVVSIADSFSSEEISTRLQISKAKGIFCQDFILRNQKKISLYEKVRASTFEKIIVLPSEEQTKIDLHEIDLSWKTFLKTHTEFESVACDPMQTCNILFSSGTTGEPKAIPWNHTTAIKAATDAYFHQNIHANDVLAWPTNLGWMMGPWLVFASLINQAAIAIYPDSPSTREFGEFIQDAKVTMLGTVPTIVATWKQTQCMENLNWNAIKVFSSTGESSNARDMLYLMSLAKYRPVIEYCGGTEIGGAYVSSTLLQKNCPAVFTTATMGMDFVLLDGQVAIIPPSMGLSNELLNANHHEIYYADMPTLPDGSILRRHGDQLHQYKNGFYSVIGRVDDTMNLSGIKISAVEIERAIVGIEGIVENAAIAISPPNNGPNQLIIYSVTTNKNADKNTIKNLMQQKINLHLNPLFKIHDVIFVNELPKTASNKIMRRMLRRKSI